MKARNRIILTFTAAAVTGAIVYAYVSRRRKERDHLKRLARVSDEGYETAHDVLFPHSKQRRRKGYYGQEYTL